MPLQMCMQSGGKCSGDHPAVPIDYPDRAKSDNDRCKICRKILRKWRITKALVAKGARRLVLTRKKTTATPS